MRARRLLGVVLCKWVGVDALLPDLRVDIALVFFGLFASPR